jgi:hypothetical protein
MPSRCLRIWREKSLSACSPSDPGSSLLTALTISYVSRHRGGSGCASVRAARSLVGVGLRGDGLAFVHFAGLTSSSESLRPSSALTRATDALRGRLLDRGGVEGPAASALVGLLRDTARRVRALLSDSVGASSASLSSLTGASETSVTRASLADVRVRRAGVMAGEHLQED